MGDLLLPPVFFGLFFVGLLATIMSTIDSLGFISAFTFGRDIVGQISNRKWDSIYLTRIGLIVMAFLAVMFAYLLPSVVKLWYVIGSVIVPGLLIPFLATFTKFSINRKQIIFLMQIPVIISVGWFIFNNYIDCELLNIEPFYPGMIASAVLFIIINQKK